MLAGMKRDPNPVFLTERAGPHAATIDNILGFDMALVCNDAARFTALDHDIIDFDAFNNLRPALPRAFG